MSLVWVTGNSGVGKSTLCENLRSRGCVAFDTDDDGYCGWIDRNTGQPVVDPPDPIPQGWLGHFGWKVDRTKVSALAADHQAGVVYLCGSAENESEVRDLFDLTICLVLDDGALTERLRTRTNNDFGKHPKELAAALKWNPRMEGMYRRLGAVIVDAARSEFEVLERVVAAAREHFGGWGGRVSL